MAGRVTFNLFGNPELICAAESVPLKRRKTLALAAYLASWDRSCSRESLAAMFWPEQPAIKALTYLRNALWELKSSPLAPWLAADRWSVRLLPGPETGGEPVLEIDVVQFRRSLSGCAEHNHAGGSFCASCLANMERACDCYNRPFLSGFTLPDCPDFEQWLRIEEEVLRRDYIRCLHQLTDHYYYVADWPAATRAVSRWMAEDTLNESAYRHGMVVAACAGDPARCRAIYDRCRAILMDELDIEPDDETEDIFHQIRTGTLIYQPETGLPETPVRAIPSPGTPIVGRRRELEDLQALLQQPDCRLLTIAGPGGVGKSRLAIALAADRETARMFPDGIVWLALDPIRTGEPVLPALMNAVGFHSIRSGIAETATAGRKPDWVRSLTRYLGRKNLLIIMDNVEHQRTGLSFLNEMIFEDWDAKILLTSRERLHLRNEWVYALDGLEYPASGQQQTGSDAVQLMRQCLRRQDSLRQPTGSEERDMAAICRHVHGNPLAIELASVWIRTLSLDEILREIETNPSILATDREDVPVRQRSIRRIFDYTWQSLPEDVRACFGRLAVFRGGFRRDAAAEVADAGLKDLDALIGKSIIYRLPGERYGIHELLRQFAEEHLRESHRDSVRIRLRHARHYLSRLENLSGALVSYQQVETLDLLEPDFDNIRVAWLTSAEIGDMELMTRAVVALFFFFDIQSRFHEGLELFRMSGDRLAARLAKKAGSAGDRNPGHRLEAWIRACEAWFIRHADPERSARLLAESAAVLGTRGNDAATAFVEALRIYYDFEREPERIVRVLGACLTGCRSSGESWIIPIILDGLAIGRAYGTDPAALQEAAALAEQSLALRRQRGDIWGMAISRSILAGLAESAGEWERALTHHRASLSLRKKLGRDLDGVLDCLMGLSRVERGLGRMENAARYLHDARHVLEELNDFSRLAAIDDALAEMEPEANE